MTIGIYSLPNMQQYLQCYFPIKLEADKSVLAVFKSLYRSDNVIVDFYLNEISEDYKIASGKVMTPDSILALPNNSIGFNYTIECVDQDGIDESIRQYNLHKFYLQITQTDAVRG